MERAKSTFLAAIFLIGTIGDAREDFSYFPTQSGRLKAGRKIAHIRLSQIRKTAEETNRRINTVQAQMKKIERVMIQTGTGEGDSWGSVQSLGDLNYELGEARAQAQRLAIQKRKLAAEEKRLELLISHSENLAQLEPAERYEVLASLQSLASGRDPVQSAAGSVSREPASESTSSKGAY